MGDADVSARFENVRLLLVDLEGAISGLSRYGRGLPGSIGLAISGITITGWLFTAQHATALYDEIDVAFRTTDFISLNSFLHENNACVQPMFRGISAIVFSYRLDALWTGFSMRPTIRGRRG